MSERMIIKAKPPHHRQQFFVAMSLGVVAVVAVWGWQMKMTFGKFTAERQQMVNSVVLPTFTNESVDAAELQANVDELKTLLQGYMEEQMASGEAQEVEEVGIPVAEVEGATANGGEGVVAGETIEVPAN